LIARLMMQHLAKNRTRAALIRNRPHSRVMPLLLAAALALPACAGEPEPTPVEQAFTASSNNVEPGAAIAFRFPSSGGLARLYRLPSLDEVTWRFELGRRRPVRMVGFAFDDDLIYALGTSSEEDTYDLIALDLVAGRARTIDSGVVASAIGPTGTAFVAKPDGTIGQVQHRTVDLWPDTLPNPVDSIWAAARGRLIAVQHGVDGRELLYLVRGQSPERLPLPDGAIAMERWGRLAAVVVDSGLITLQPWDSESTRFIAISPQPRLAAFSASGHKIYVVAGDETLVVVDRFLQAVGASIQLPGRISAIRVGPLGLRALAFSAQEGTIWVVDLIQRRVETTLAGSWDSDLPAIAADGTILVRRAGSLVAFAGEQMEEAGVSDAGTDDLWLVAQWDPRRPALELARDSAQATDESEASFLVQISSSHNAAWAQALADELSRAGMPATVLAADSVDGFYRVVMGPYSTREEAEASARRLDRPFYIRENTSTIP